jgi:uncharacterized protein DUF3780
LSKETEILIGFGFLPLQNEHHFVVIIPKPPKQDVTIHELPHYDKSQTVEGIQANFLGPEHTGKVMLHPAKWKEIERFARVEFNQKLKASGRRSSKFKQGINRLHRLFGKELMVLAWAIEDANPGDVPQAIENWLGLKPEERWWLYTMTNAATGHPTIGRGQGWRKALRYALTENPVPEGRYTQSLLDEEKHTLFEEEEKDLYKTK